MAVRSTQELMMRLDHMRGRRGSHENVWQEISDLTMPWRGDILTKRSDGSRRVNGIFDSTAILMAEQFASFLKGAVVPSGSDWLRYTIDGTDDDIEVRELLDIVARKVLRELHRSNFYPQAGTFLRDMSVLGNGTMATMKKPSLKNAGWTGLMFEAVPVRRVWWHVGPTQTPEIIFREIEMTALDAFRFFGGRAGATVDHFLARNMRMEQVSFFHAVYQNEEGVPGGLTPPERKPWISQWIEPLRQELLRTSGFENNPYVVGRWMAVDGEEYGRGRGHLARIDAKGLNELRRQILIAVGKDLLPPIVVENESVVEFDVGPDGIMVSKPPLKFNPYHLKSGADYPAADAMADRDRAQVRAAFFGDALSEPESQDRSAEASRQRQARAIQRMAAPAEVVEKDFLGPVVATVTETMHRHGQLEEIDQLGEMLGETEADIQFVSPFFTAQKAAPLERVRAFLGERLALFQGTKDEVWLRDVDPEGVTKLERRLADLPAEIFRTEQELESLKAVEAQKDAVQRALEIRSAIGGGSQPRTRAPLPAASPAALPGGELAAEAQLG
jgi:hypothetical protein